MGYNPDDFEAPPHRRQIWVGTGLTPTCLLNFINKVYAGGFAPVMQEINYASCLRQSVLYGESENQFNKPLVEMVVGLQVLHRLNSLQVLIS